MLHSDLNKQICAAPSVLLSMLVLYLTVSLLLVTVSLVKLAR